MSDLTTVADTSTQIAETQASATGIGSVASEFSSLSATAQAAAFSMQQDAQILAPKQAQINSLKQQILALGGTL